MLSQLHLALTLLSNMHKTSAGQSIPSRMVFMTSAMHENVPKTINFSSTDEINYDIGQQALYYRSKLAQIVIVRELVRRGMDTGNKSRVLINATHPGDFNRTPLIEQLRIAFGIWGTLLLFFLSPFMPDPITTGCRSALFAATPNKEILSRTAQSGQYIVPDKKIRQPSKMAQDLEMGLRLWRLSMHLLEEKIGKLPYSTYV
jgi:WW domain-containing oxidoreductase